MSNIGKQPPYREACWGYGAKFAFGCNQQHAQADAVRVQQFNTTRVRTWKTEGPLTIPPYSRPEARHFTCGCVGVSPCDELPCGPWPLPPLTNTYISPVPSTKVDLSTCQKAGFKQIYALKQWHGVPGFLEVDGCTPSSAEACYGVPNQRIETRYLTREISVTVTTTGTQQAYSSKDGTTYNFHRKYSVGRHTGVITLADCVQEAPTELNGTDGPATPSEIAGWLTAVSQFAEMNFACGQWTGPTDSNPTFNISMAAATPNGVYDGTFGGLTTFYKDAGSNYLVVNIKSQSLWPDFPDSVEYKFEVRLSDPYNGADVWADMQTLLRQWDFTDDAQFPWRADSLTTSGPLVTFWENTPTGVDAGFWTDCGWVDTNIQDGRILGAPRPAGSDPYFDSMFVVYQTFTGGGGPYIDAAWYGDYAPFWARHATQWTDLVWTSVVPAGAFYKFTGGTLTGCQYAEALLPAPSHDFARPCGDHDLTQRMQTGKTCEDGTGAYRWPSALCDCRDVTRPRNARTNLCPEPASPAPVNPWWDRARKGDFTVRVWSYNFRDVGENARRIANALINVWPPCDGNPDEAVLRPVTGALTDLTVLEACQGVWSPCKPWTVLITATQDYDPNGPHYAPGQMTVVRFPAYPGLDARYGNFWQAKVAQWMQDPLWETPLPPCDLPDSVGWREDDGSCTVIYVDPATGDSYLTYPMRPWEEARATRPFLQYNGVVAQAPALPAGLYLGGSCLTVAQLNCAPPAAGVQALAAPDSVWLTWLLMQGCIATSGAYAAQYSEAAEDRMDVPVTPIF